MLIDVCSSLSVIIELSVANNRAASIIARRLQWADPTKGNVGWHDGIALARGRNESRRLSLMSAAKVKSMKTADNAPHLSRRVDLSSRDATKGPIERQQYLPIAGTKRQSYLGCCPGEHSSFARRSGMRNPTDPEPDVLAVWHRCCR
jgi:hypothetical protein